MILDFKRIDENTFAIDYGSKRVYVIKSGFAGLNATIFLKGQEQPGISERVKKTLLNGYGSSECNQPGAKGGDGD